MLMLEIFIGRRNLPKRIQGCLDVGFYLTYFIWFNGEDMRNDDINIQLFDFYCSHNVTMVIASTPSIPASTPLSGLNSKPPRKPAIYFTPLISRIGRTMIKSPST